MLTSSGLQRVSGSPAHIHPSANPSSLGLLQLVSEHGISASTRPISPLTQKALAAHTTTSDFGSTEQRNREQTLQSIFSLNLVEKLRSLGLYKVVARGFVDFRRKEMPDSNNSHTWSSQTIKEAFCTSSSFWHAADLFPFIMEHYLKPYWLKNISSCFHL